MHIIYPSFAALIHACCIFFIVSVLKSKPLGAQTLVDLVMANTLVVQCVHIFGHVLVLNWSFSVSSPRDDIICTMFTIVIIYSSLFHALFLLLNVLTKYVCVFHSTYQEMLQDSKVIKTMWSFVIIVSTAFIILEFIFIHDFQSMNTYKELKVSWFPFSILLNIKEEIEILDECRYKLRLVYFLPHFSLWFILQTVNVLKKRKFFNFWA